MSSTLTPERIEKRLTRIFIQAFPSCEKDKAKHASVYNTDGWDSIGTLTLLSLIDEDLGIKIGYDRIGNIKSFDDIYNIILESVNND